MLASRWQGLPCVEQQRRAVDHQLGLVAHHRDLGDVVLDRLELADLLAERAALLGVVERVLEHAVEDPAAERADHHALVVERRQQHVPRLAGLAEHVGVGDEDVAQVDLAGADRAHPELAQLGDVHALGLGVEQEQRDALVALDDVVVGAGQQQDVVGDVRGRAPDLRAVDLPAAVDRLGLGLHRAEHVGAAVGLGEADREAQLALGDPRQQPLLLLVGAVEADRLRARERRDAPHPAEAAERAAQLARQDHLGHDVAALAAVLLGDAEAVIAGLA